MRLRRVADPTGVAPMGFDWEFLRFIYAYLKRRFLCIIRPSRIQKIAIADTAVKDAGKGSTVEYIIIINIRCDEGGAEKRYCYKCNGKAMPTLALGRGHGTRHPTVGVRRRYPTQPRSVVLHSPSISWSWWLPPEWKLRAIFTNKIHNFFVHNRLSHFNNCLY